MRLETYISVGLQIVTNNYSKCYLQNYKAQTKFDIHIIGTILNSKNFSFETDIKCKRKYTKTTYKNKN